MLEDFHMRPDAPPPLPFKFAAPLKDLGTFDAAEELMLQYQRAENLSANVLNNDEIPANQRAQVLGAVTAILAQIIKLQTDLHNSEQFKKIERTLADTLKRFPEVQEDFLLMLARDLT